MNRQLRVAVVGCGTAGAATALFLSRAGHDVVVFERVARTPPRGGRDYDAAVGALVLEQLGLESGARARRARELPGLRDSRGRSSSTLATRRSATELHGVGLHRGVLFETLFGALGASEARIACGIADRRASVRFETVKAGSSLASAANAARSISSSSATAPAPACATRCRRSRRTCDPTRGARCGSSARIARSRHAARLHQIVRGAGEMIGFLPTGLGPGERHVPLVSLFVSIRAERIGDAKKAGPRRVQARRATARADRRPGARPDPRPRSAHVRVLLGRHDAALARARRGPPGRRGARDQPAARPGVQPRALRRGGARGRDRRRA